VAAALRYNASEAGSQVLNGAPDGSRVDDGDQPDQCTLVKGPRDVRKTTTGSADGSAQDLRGLVDAVAAGNGNRHVNAVDSDPEYRRDSGGADAHQGDIVNERCNGSLDRGCGG
jgi:hypothetical protein